MIITQNKKRLRDNNRKTRLFSSHSVIHCHYTHFLCLLPCYDVNSAPMDIMVVVPVEFARAFSASSATFAAAEAATVDLEKSATIRKYEATAAIVCLRSLFEQSSRVGHQNQK